MDRIPLKYGVLVVEPPVAILIAERRVRVKSGFYFYFYVNFRHGHRHILNGRMN